jgi:hypothetical protein
MCNIYTLAPWEVRHLIQHYRLIGRDFEEAMRGRNETLDVYLRLAGKPPAASTPGWVATHGGRPVS